MRPLLLDGSAPCSTAFPPLRHHTQGSPIYGLVYDCATGRLREVMRCEAKGGVVPESLEALAEEGKQSAGGGGA